MRYELSDCEWSVIMPMLPNEPRGVPRVNDRRVLNGIFWVLRSGAPWRDLPETYGPCIATIGSFAGGGPASGTGSWRRWPLLMMRRQMIDTSVVRVHQHGACIAGNQGAAHGPFARRTDQQGARRC